MISKIFRHHVAIIIIITLSFLLAKRQSDYFVTSAVYALFLFLIFNTIQHYKNSKQLTFNPLSLLLVVWVSWLFVPLCAHWINPTALFGIMHCSAWVLMYLLVIQMPFNQDIFWRMTKNILFLLALISALIGLYQHYYLHHMAVGLFASRNSNGIFIVLAAVLVLGDLLIKKQPSFLSNHVIKATLLFIFNSALFLSLSRGVLLSYLISIIFLLSVNLKYLNKKYLYITLTLFLLSLVLFLINTHQSLNHRIMMLHDEQSRLLIWKGAWNLWLASPWYGIGLFNFKYYYKAFSLPGDNSSLEYAHNDYLQLLLETGIPGALIILLVGLFLCFIGIRYLKNPNPDRATHIAITSLFAILIAFLSHSFVDYNFYLLPMNMLLGVLIAMLILKLGRQYVPRYSLPFAKVKTSFLLTTMICSIFISFFCFKLLMFSYYSDKAELAKNRQDYYEAITANNQALKWLEHPEIHSKQADLHIEIGRAHV